MTHGTRRTAARWAAMQPAPAPRVDVLIPTVNRPAELATTLAGLAAQDDPPFRVIVSDQSDAPVAETPAVAAMLRVLRAQGRPVETLRHLPRRGVAEQRRFLLEHARAPEVLFLDDDVWLEPGALARLAEALETLECGFVGMAVQGLSYLEDRRPHELEPFQPWDGPVRPERVRRQTSEFDRFRLHNAANLAHLAVQLDLDEDAWLAYHVAWIGGCVLYRRDALVETDAFGFWDELPADHSGEDVATQWRILQTRGGAGLLPSAAVHLEAPTTLPRREVDAVDVVFTDDRKPGNREPGNREPGKTDDREKRTINA